MNNKDKQECIARYSKRLAAHGFSPLTLGWTGDITKQYARYKANTDLGLFAAEEIKTVLDNGCGFGDFGEWMKAQKFDITYKGIDINQDLINQGHSRYCSNIHHGDIYSVKDERFDLVCANGIFNYKLQHQDQLEYIENTIKGMLDIARIGIAIDFLSSYVDYKNENCYHAREEDIIRICKKLGKRSVIRNDYLPYEFMVYLLK